MTCILEESKPLAKLIPANPAPTITTLGRFVIGIFNCALLICFYKNLRTSFIIFVALPDIIRWSITKIGRFRKV